MQFQAFGLPLPRFCLVCDFSCRGHEVQRRHRNQGHQVYYIRRAKEGGAGTSTAPGILILCLTKIATLTGK